MPVPGHRPSAPIRWVRNPELLTRSGAFGVLVLAASGSRPLLLEGTAVDLWLAVGRPKTDGQLVAELADRYGVEIGLVETDVHSALEQLRAAEIVVPAPR